MTGGVPPGAAELAAARAAGEMLLRPVICQRSDAHPRKRVCHGRLTIAHPRRRYDWPRESGFADELLDMVRDPDKGMDAVREFLAAQENQPRVVLGVWMYGPDDRLVIDPEAVPDGHTPELIGVLYDHPWVDAADRQAGSRLWNDGQIRDMLAAELRDFDEFDHGEMFAYRVEIWDDHGDGRWQAFTGLDTGYASADAAARAAAEQMGRWQKIHRRLMAETVCAVLAADPDVFAGVPVDARARMVELAHRAELPEAPRCGTCEVCREDAVNVHLHGVLRGDQQQREALADT